MIKRQGYKYKIPEEARERIKNKQCPSCGLHKDKWKRRTDWRCCSVKCTTDYEKNIVLRFWWVDIRLKAFKRDKFTCVKCGTKEDAINLIGDHIKPIALGGEEFDINNVQTLCMGCDKIKTKQDQKKIARERRIEKVQEKNQTLVTVLQRKTQ